VPGRAEARAKLGLDPEREIVVAVTGGGGSGTPYAPLTVAARAAPDTLWLTLGPTHREGHETDFSNLRELGWVSSVTDYLAAADIVVASAGDNTVHEVARVGGRLIVMPEWRYFGEQTRKAEALVRLGAAVQAPVWPGDLQGWRDLLARARGLDPAPLRSLYAPDAAARAAGWLEGLTDELWHGATDPAALTVVAAG
jgi:UDP-N-acetylglucosamine--N-acetylmuramyl-(pentapeptide) pyrophosphoryl-undecaprenol N-acetylglucosamine transferase